MEEDGSWGAVSECLVAVAVTWDKNHEFRIWYEKDVPTLLEELTNFVQIPFGQKTQPTHKYLQQPVFPLSTVSLSPTLDSRVPFPDADPLITESGSS
jgi:hypothetical protein